MSIIKAVIILLLAGIILSLGSGLTHLVKDAPGSNGVAKALTFRISLSIALVILLAIGFFTGLIAPHSVG